MEQDHFQRACDLHGAKRFAEAAQACALALQQQPAHFGACVLLGRALHEERRFEEAADTYDRALALQPLAPLVHYFRANALAEAGRAADAIGAYSRAIALKPDFDEAFRNRGIARLSIGDCENGWPDYEHRLPRDRSRRMLAWLDAPDWTGESLQGKSIIVSDATGLGDVLMFSRYLPKLVERGARVSFFGNARLYRLLATLDAPVTLLDAVPRDARFDFHSKLLSLPYRFGTTLDSIPGRQAYLHAEPALVQRWRERVGLQDFRIGVCWKGNPDRTIDGGRSIPLAGLAGLAKMPGVRLISLQKRFGLEELQALPEGMRVTSPGEDFDEGPDAFVDSAALMQSLDLVIASCTSVAHLAGALGRPAWIGLKHAPEWRWLRGRSDCPWYPSLRLFRQVSRDDWSHVFNGMESCLAELLAERDAAGGQRSG